jgi:hypothetical protein
MSLSFSCTTEFLILNRRLSLETTTRSNAIGVRVFPQWFKQATISWTVPAAFGNVEFNVYFSSSEDSGFQKLNSEPLTTMYFTDTTIQEYSKYNRGFYVVEAILLDKNNVTVRSKPVSWEPAQRDWVQLRAIEIQRREYWLLSRFVGVKSYLFRKKHFGKRCPYCWNPTLELIMDDKCVHCMGTSFENGFYNCSPTTIQYEPNTNSLIKSYFGVSEPNAVGAWTISVPEIRPDDIIVKTGSWQVFTVSRMEPTELQGNTVRQRMLLTELGKNDIEYALIGRNLPEFPQQYFDSTVPNYEL